MKNKFRAWDKELKVMVYDNETTGHIEYDTNPVRAINIMLNEDDYGLEFMQDTGLKDRNGTEIYVGDIVINTGKWFLHARQFYSNQVGIGYGEGEKMVAVKGKAGIELRCIEDFIRQKDGNFAPNGYFHKPYVDNYTAWNLQSTLKVIGNIYENPELLEGGK